MNVTARNCQTRRDLEAQGSILRIRLSNLAPKLMTLVAVDHHGFNITSAQCREVRGQLKESSRRLQAHRTEHGC
ncbi:MAG TPA: hypothetical protein VFW25_14610 [Silvibacterium sp.]|nr:hypothetical protein [Silvibacterium sp.]